jgi:hypothetical protein
MIPSFIPSPIAWRGKYLEIPVEPFRGMAKGNYLLLYPCVNFSCWGPASCLPPLWSDSTVEPIVEALAGVASSTSPSPELSRLCAWHSRRWGTQPVLSLAQPCIFLSRHLSYLKDIRHRVRSHPHSLGHVSISTGAAGKLGP